MVMLLRNNASNKQKIKSVNYKTLTPRETKGHKRLEGRDKSKPYSIKQSKKRGKEECWDRRS